MLHGLSRIHFTENHGRESKHTEKRTPARSLLVPIDPVIARTAVRVRRGMKDGGIADAIVYATALRHRAKVVTGDPHLRGMSEVVFAGKG